VGENRRLGCPDEAKAEIMASVERYNTAPEKPVF